MAPSSHEVLFAPLLSRVEHEWGAVTRKLEAWCTTRALAEYEIEAPTPHSISAAMAVAEHFVRQGVPQPSRLSPNGAGGISFEFRRGTSLEVLEVTANGSVHYERYLDSTLVDEFAVPVL